MAVFTPVTRPQAERWIAQYDIGPLTGFEGIASGIENSNFFVTTRRGRYVLTVFERLAADQLPFYLGLMRHLARHGIPCPDPLANRDGEMLGSLHGKPAALVTRLRGTAIVAPTAAHCEQVGRLLARMHLAASDFPGALPNLRGLPWWRETVPLLLDRLDACTAEVLADELEAQLAFAADARHARLPRSAVHADLFRDNVLFDGDRLGGVIDFYFAGVDTWMFDLAVTCNDWCIVESSAAFDPARLAALLGAYRAVRRLEPDEIEAWPMMLRAAALRFWVSRLYDLHMPRPAQMVTPKDPTHFERVLRERRRGAPPLA